MCARVFKSTADFIGRQAGNVSSKARRMKESYIGGFSEDGIKNLFEKTDKSFFPQVKMKYAVPAAGIVVGGSVAYNVADGHQQAKNRMNLGHIDADPYGHPNQVTANISPTLRHMERIETTRMDNHGADGELAMALHNLKNGGQF